MTPNICNQIQICINMHLNIKPNDKMEVYLNKRLKETWFMFN